MSRLCIWIVAFAWAAHVASGPLEAQGSPRTFLGAGAQFPAYPALEERWQRPAVGSLERGDAFWESSAFYVSETGTYTMVQRVVTHYIDLDFTEPVEFPRVLFLYAQSFDPSRPGKNLVATHDVSDAADEITVRWPLLAHNVYHLVVSTVDEQLPLTLPLGPDSQVMGLEWTLSGPGEIGRNHCRFTDDVSSDADGLAWDVAAAMAPTRGAFPVEQMCLSVAWFDDSGGGHVARVAPQRTRDSVLFYFFAETNWEIQAKIIDACDVNDSYWLLVSSSTDVPFELELRWLGYDAYLRQGSPHFVPGLSGGTLVIRSPGGQPAETLIDTRSIGCDIHKRRSPEADVLRQPSAGRRSLSRQ